MTAINHKQGFLTSPVFWLMLAMIMAAEVGCRTLTTVQDDQLKTDATRGILNDACVEPLGDLKDSLVSLCSCLEGSDTATCQAATTYLQHAKVIKKTLIREGAYGYRPGGLEPDQTSSRAQPLALSAREQQCLDFLAEAYVENSLALAAQRCKTSPNTWFQANVLNNPFSTPEDQCWRLVAMTADACIKAEPCGDSPHANANALPLTSSGHDQLRGLYPNGLVPSGRTVILCNERIQTMHRLKDPTQKTVTYTLPFIDMLTNGASAPIQSFGAANCHGVAQYIAGGIFDDIPVTGITYHSEAVRRQCAVQAEAAFNAATKARSFPIAAALPIDRGGFQINMKHSNCQRQECGQASFHISNCSPGELSASILIQDLCVACWNDKLVANGLESIPSNATWRDFKPGCILTSNDHSITLLMINDGLCYYYESISPFGPPHLRVDYCPNIALKFARGWCPSQSLKFSILRTAE